MASGERRAYRSSQTSLHVEARAGDAWKAEDSLEVPHSISAFAFNEAGSLIAVGSAQRMLDVFALQNGAAELRMHFELQDSFRKLEFVGGGRLRVTGRSSVSWYELEKNGELEREA